MVDQYANALRVLVDPTDVAEYGWGMSRPILFTVHQLCENALDVAIKRSGVGGVPTSGRNQHALDVRMAGALRGGVYDELMLEEREWCERFVETIVPLTGNGFPGRYVDARISGRLQLDDVWCCINPPALRDAAVLFAGLTLLQVAELSVPTAEISAS
ncbi:hypothetical protein [Microbacterium maritypicum]